MNYYLVTHSKALILDVQLCTWAKLTSVSHWSGVSWQPCRILSLLKLASYSAGGTLYTCLVWPLLLKILWCHLVVFPCTCRTGCSNFLLMKPLDAQILVFLPGCRLIYIFAEYIQLLRGCICTSWLSGGSCTLTVFKEKAW